MNERQAQKDRIAQFIRDGGRVTTLSAVYMFQCCRLSERIREAEADGLSVQRKRIKVGTKTVTEYSLAEPQMRLL